MATVRAKFSVVNVVSHSYPNAQEYSREVHLSAVTGKDSRENFEFWSATPSGQLTLYITNPDAFERFHTGDDFYLDFTPADG